MTISYNWLCEYIQSGGQSLASITDPEKLGKILTSIGLEVESLKIYEEVTGNLSGLVIGEVVQTEKHPNADKLTLTKVAVGKDEPLNIVCGAPNVAAGQKVVVATVGTTIYPVKGDPITMKKAKIRGVESEGMICAEDEIGLGESHEGILVLENNAKVGMSAKDYFNLYTDWIYEIGLTPNRMDAMSHLGVAKDVCAYLNHHEKKSYTIKSPFSNSFKPDNKDKTFEVIIENTEACQRYAGICINGVTVKESPQWMQKKLKSIGLRPINNIVDITNFILHETGQPLHAFDADEIKGKKVIVKNLPEKTLFVSLDEKERKLSNEDLMICNGESEPMCIGGVFGGLHSGVSDTTRNIFLESAWFNPVSIRKSSFRHGLRTDAALRFEKGVDISNTVHVLKRAAQLIKELAGGVISGDIIDVYPNPKTKTEVVLKNHYLKKLSGKKYHPDTVKEILTNLGFEIIKESLDDIRVAVPYCKPDISLPADIVEEIMRIDGLDNVEIPESITITPSTESLLHTHSFKEKTAAYLVGLGYHEIITNSITNSAYYDDTVLSSTVKMMNNLSAELNIMRPRMLESGLETIAYNHNRKNNDILFFEFGKTYSTSGSAKYSEAEHLTLYATGASAISWNSKSSEYDFYKLKGTAEAILRTIGITDYEWTNTEHNFLSNCISIKRNRTTLGEIGVVKSSIQNKFNIKTPVFYADFLWDQLMIANQKIKIKYSEISKYPEVQRDLSMVLDKTTQYGEIEKLIWNKKPAGLKSINLFDVFESEKLGKDKKSLAINFTFSDNEKTFTDKEIESKMNQIIASLEKELNAEIRKQ